MLPEGEFHMLRDLYRQGLSISEIARQTGYNRRTVSKYVKAKVPPVSRKPSAKPWSEPLQVDNELSNGNSWGGIK